MLNEEIILVNKYPKIIKPNYVKVGRKNFHYIKVQKLWERLVNSEFMLDELWMKKNSEDSALDFF